MKRTYLTPMCETVLVKGERIMLSTSEKQVTGVDGGWAKDFDGDDDDSSDESVWED